MKKIFPFCLLWCMAAVPSAFSQAGLLDASFSDDGKVISSFPVSGDDKIFSLAIQPDQKILAAGNAQGSTTTDFGLARYLPNGSPDLDFGLAGRLTTNFGTGTDVGKSVVLQNDGKIIVAGYATINNIARFALARYLENGDLDLSFGLNGLKTTTIGSGNSECWSVALQADGKIVLAGTAQVSATTGIFALARYTSEGELDPDFGQGGIVTTGIDTLNSHALSVAIQPDGKIVAAGYSRVNGHLDFALARYNTDGSLDSNFGNSGTQVTDFNGFDDYAQAMTLQADGKIVLAGRANAGNTMKSCAIARYTSDGILDPTFGLNGKTKINFHPIGVDEGFQAVTMQSDGKIVAAGYLFIPSFEVYNFGLARFQKNGQLDPDFNGTGKVTTAFQVGNDKANAVAIQADGKIVAGGSSASLDFALARYLPGSVVGVIDPAVPGSQVFLYPNPVDQSTLVEYTLLQMGRVSITLYDQLGKVVARPIDQVAQNAGVHRQSLALPDDLPAGMYVLKLVTPGRQRSLKFVK